MPISLYLSTPNEIQLECIVRVKVINGEAFLDSKSLMNDIRNSKVFKKYLEEQVKRV